MVSALSLAIALTLLHPGQGSARPSTKSNLSILFLGNSHTAGHQLPEMVKAMLESSGEKVQVRAHFGGFLDDLAQNPEVLKEIDSGRWTFVVLQGAKLSSSHRFEYSKQSGIDLAKRTLKARGQPILFAEHPRRGWDEAAWQFGQYQQIQKQVAKSSNGQRAEIVPVCFAFDEARKKSAKLDLWEYDGNHANLAGSYLSAATIAQFLRPDAKINFIPKGLEPALAKSLLTAAKQTVQTRR